MTPAQHPMWLATARDPIFAVFHAADPDQAPDRPVLIVPPWGWHEVASYRSRRTWAAHLADRGRATLRIDLPGTGDSGGSASTADLVAAWIDGVDRAATWLAEAVAAPAVGVIGLGLGGLVAAQAIAGGAPIDRLVAWAVPADGREEVRRHRAFARLQGPRYSLTEPEPALLPDGWLEVNGFVLSADAITALGALRVPAPATGHLRRALVLDADGIPAAPSVIAGLRRGGVEVVTEAGPGWAAMTSHPQHDEPPMAVFETVDRWLDDGARVDTGAAGRPSVGATTRGVGPAAARVEAVTIGSSATTTLHADGITISETVIVRSNGHGALFGILAAPESPRPTPVAALFLNAGAVRRIGPNGIWVDTSRRWARAGVPTLRIDLDGIGDSDGDSARYHDVGEFYARVDLADQIRALSDELVARTGASRIVLAGLCAGGYWAFLGADRDPRVVAAYLLNPGALEWRPDLVQRRNARRILRLGDVRWWSRLLRGHVRLSRIRAIAVAALREGVGLRAASGTSATRNGVPSPEMSPRRIVDRLAARGTTVVLAFSDDEALHDELARDGFLDHAARLATVHLEALPGRDHTLRPIVAQQAVHALLDRALRADLDRLAGAADTGAA